MLICHISVWSLNMNMLWFCGQWSIKSMNIHFKEINMGNSYTIFNSILYKLGKFQSWKLRRLVIRGVSINIWYLCEIIFSFQKATLNTSSALRWLSKTFYVKFLIIDIYLWGKYLFILFLYLNSIKLKFLIQDLGRYGQ